MAKPIRKELENIINALNENNQIIAKSFLTWLLEKQTIDDDIMTKDDLAALKQAREELANGETISLEELKSELNL